MKEGSILVILKCVVDLLVPYYTAISRRYVDQLDPECIAH